MPVPSSIASLSATAGSNYPLGSESPSTADDYFRAHASFIAQLRAVVGGATNPDIPSAAADLALNLLDAADPAKGAGMVGWKRSTLAKQIATAGDFLNLQPFSLWEFADQITDKPDPGDFTTWDWAPAVYAAIQAPAVAGHAILVHEGCQIKTTVTVDKSVRFMGSPFKYGRGSFFNLTDTTLVMFRIRAHYVVFDGIVIEGPGKAGTSVAIEVGDGAVNYDKFMFTGDSFVFKWNTGIELKTQNWTVSNGAAASTCAIGFRASGLPTTNDRRNGYFINANCHSCDTGIFFPNQFQVVGIVGCDFNTCVNGVSGKLLRSVIGSNNFFNCSGYEINITDCLSNTISGNMITGDTTVANTGTGISASGTSSAITGNTVTNKGGHGINAALSASSITGNICTDNNFFDAATYDGIVISGNSNSVTGNVSRTTTGGASKQRYGIHILSGTGNVVEGNVTSGNKTAQIIPGTGNIVRNNSGYVTENRGTASITTAATSVTVTHGLSFTPTAANISIILTNSTNAAKWWITNITATTFDIVVNVAPGTGTQFFGWQAAS